VVILRRVLEIIKGTTKATDNSPFESPKCSGRATMVFAVKRRYMRKSKAQHDLLTPLERASKARDPTPIPAIIATNNLGAKTLAYSADKNLFKTR
jgi:hypothetical protein